jgi:hypothetical protein
VCWPPGAHEDPQWSQRPLDSGVVTQLSQWPHLTDFPSSSFPGPSGRLLGGGGLKGLGVEPVEITQERPERESDLSKATEWGRGENWVQLHQSLSDREEGQKRTGQCSQRAAWGGPKPLSPVLVATSQTRLDLAAGSLGNVPLGATPHPSAGPGQGLTFWPLLPPGSISSFGLAFLSLPEWLVAWGPCCLQRRHGVSRRLEPQGATGPFPTLPVPPRPVPSPLHGGDAELPRNVLSLRL